MEQQQQQYVIYPPGFKEYWYRVLNFYPPDRHEDAKEFIKQLVAHVINNGQLATYDWYTAPIPELAPVFETEDVLEDQSIATEVLMNMTGDSSEDQENIMPDILTQTDQHSQFISITPPFSITAAACSEPSQIFTERSIPSFSSSSSSSSSYSSYAKRRRQRERNRSSKHDDSNNDFNFIWNPSLTTMQTEWMKE
ncbi:hypothetical protein RclHR1_08550005 [Rhizophagus clarus]|nr:hypothetical protein RclHR1_08550005 [Rhizophagus clarus]